LAARIVFAPKDHADAREISDELGFTTVKVRSLSKPIFDLSDTKGRRQRSVNISEQRRALLLPQEVKGLGSHQAIIFYEGLQPIRCLKIRYFEDRRFKARLLPPPVQAIPTTHTPSKDGREIKAHNILEGASASAPQSPSDSTPREPALEARPATREATAADIDRLESLKLDDFAPDFGNIKLPQKAEGERLTSDELTAAAESFLDTLRTG
jgi:type IV secretion system protein VirD4